MFLDIKSKQTLVNGKTGLVKKILCPHNFKFIFWLFSNKLNIMRKINTFLGK
jgi:hypothetical protein